MTRCFVILALLIGCHLGRPPTAAQAGGVSLGVVEVAAAEPGLADALRVGIADALARRSLLGAGPAVDLSVLEASTDVAAVAGLARIHRARLVIEARLLGPTPRQVVLRADRSYELPSTDGQAGAAARAAVFAALAAELADDLAAWLQQAPVPAFPTDARTP